MPTQASLDKKPEVIMDAVYQVQTPSGKFKKKYVKTTRTYGDEDGTPMVETKVVLDRNNPKFEGQVQSYYAESLGEPDTYPKFMFQPSIWEAKAKQTLNEVKAEAEGVIDTWFATNVMAFNQQDDADKVVHAIKELLSGYFGGFMLSLILHWIKVKIETRLETSNINTHAMPFERKLGTLRRELQERQANLALPQAERGQWNAQHPFGKPREVQEFGQKQGA